MITHSSFGERAGLEQDRVGDGHLANVVQQRPAPQVDQVASSTFRACASRRVISVTRRLMPLGLLVAQVQRARPALDPWLCRP